MYVRKRCVISFAAVPYFSIKYSHCDPRYEATVRIYSFFYLIRVRVTQENFVTRPVLVTASKMFGGGLASL